MDMKFASGLLVGFFLAVGIMFCAVEVVMGPHYDNIKTAKPYAEQAYALTHSPTYGDAQAFVAKIREGAAYVATLPFLGGVVNEYKVQQYVQAAVDMMQNAKQSSETVLQMINFTLALIESALLVIVISVIMIAVGCSLYLKETGNGAMPKKKGKK